MKDVKTRALSLIERNMTTFREAGEYIDSAAAVARAEQTVAGIDALMAQRADWATTNVLSMRQEAWTQGVSDIQFASQRLPTGIQASMEGSFGQVFPEAAFSAIEHPVLGVAPGAMFNGVRAGTTQSMRNVLVNAVVNGESVVDTGRALSDALDISIAAGQRIARTNVNAAYNEAQRAVYDANSDIIAGYTWEATLDDRTSQVCFMLHGQFWPTGARTPGPPAHWNCRSILLPVFRDPAVQEILDQTPRRARRYDKNLKRHDTLLKSSTTPEQWARAQPSEITLRITGSKLKNGLFRRGMIGFDDIVDPSLRVRTDQEIIKRAAGLHPGNAALQKQARAMGIKAIPSPASIRRADTALARKQPWRTPLPRPDRPGLPDIEKAYRSRTTDAFIRGPGKDMSERQIRNDLDKLNRRFAVVERGSREEAGIISRAFALEKELDKRKLDIVTRRKRDPLPRKAIVKKRPKRVVKKVPKKRVKPSRSRIASRRKIRSRQDMIDIARERMAAGEIPEVTIVEEPLVQLFGNARTSVYAQYSTRRRVIRLNTLATGWSTLPRDAASYYKRGFWSSANPMSLIDHEVGHAAHHIKIGSRFVRLRELTTLEKQLIKKHVSRYALTDAVEFVAEVYSARLDGRRFPASIMNLYREFGGP
jgi:SPP1 gp7 family putative phage head morphogenesis protein